MKVACLQMVSTHDINANFDSLYAALNGLSNDVQLLLLPENFVAMTNVESDKCRIAETLGDGPIQSKLKAVASKYKLTLVAGTIPILSEQHGKVYATTLVYSPSGKLLYHYNKYFLFDVVVNESESYRESDTVQRGASFSSVIETDVGLVGIAICYDLRFAEIFLHLVNLGVEIICVPAAFTYETGKHHWQTLLRARAIECQAFVLGANQGGVHCNGRRTFGHSAIFDPYGKALAMIEDGIGLIEAELSLDYLYHVRERMPIATHRASTSL